MHALSSQFMILSYIKVAYELFSWLLNNSLQQRGFTLFCWLVKPFMRNRRGRHSHKSLPYFILKRVYFVATPSFNLKLVKASQTVASLRPMPLPAFDFTPGDRLKARSSNGMYHLGDINLRLKTGNDTAWTSYSTATDRHPVKAIHASGNVLAAAELSATLPSTIPIQVKRYWETDNNKLTLRFELTNTTNQTVRIGALGIPMIFNNLLEGETLRTGAC